MVIDEPTLMNALHDLAIKYRLERERTKSVARTIYKAKQEAILEVIDIVNGMEKMPTVLVQRDQEAKNDANPWRYFREAGGGIVRVRDGSDSSYFYCPSEPPEKSSIHLEWWLNAANQNPSIWGEITEDEAAKIVGGRPWATQRDHPSHSP